MNNMEISKETLVAFPDGRRVLAGAPNRALLLRWATEGLKIPGHEQRVSLEYCRIGKGWYTSEEAYQRFLQKINQGDN